MNFKRDLSNQYPPIQNRIVGEKCKSATFFRTLYASELARLRMHEYRTNKIRAFGVYKIADERVSLFLWCSERIAAGRNRVRARGFQLRGAGYRMPEKKSDAVFFYVRDESSVTLRPSPTRPKRGDQSELFVAGCSVIWAMRWSLAVLSYTSDA